MLKNHPKNSRNKRPKSHYLEPTYKPSAKHSHKDSNPKPSIKSSKESFVQATNKPIATLKVLGGIYKGRKLQMASLETTRSSKAILKESLFNTLGLKVVGANFVEFFAGSGSIGIEALSRGAKSAWFFEKNYIAYKVLQANLQTICQNGENYRVILGDTFSCYSSSLKGLESLSIGYFDPPFPNEDFKEIYLECFRMIENLNKSQFSLIVLEHLSSLEIPNAIGAFIWIKTRKFGRSSLSYFE